MGGYTQPYSRHYAIPTAKLGLSAVTLASARNSNPFSVRGYSQLEVDFELTHGAGATTAFTFHFEHRRKH